MKLKWIPVCYDDFTQPPRYQDPEACLEACLMLSWDHLRKGNERTIPRVSTAAFGWAGGLGLLSEKDIDTINETFKDGIEEETLFILLCLLEELYRV